MKRNFVQDYMTIVKTYIDNIECSGNGLYGPQHSISSIKICGRWHDIVLCSFFQSGLSSKNFLLLILGINLSCVVNLL